LSNKSHEHEFRNRCLTFYEVAVQETLKRLPLNNNIISEFQFVMPNNLLKSTNKIGIDNICSKYENIIDTEQTLLEYEKIYVFFSEDEKVG
jgi:hypothetical protein